MTLPAGPSRGRGDGAGMFIDGPHSGGLRRGLKNRLHAQKAIILWCMGARPARLIAPASAPYLTRKHGPLWAAAMTAANRGRSIHDVR